MTTGALSGEATQPQLATVELHWMQESDVAMHDSSGVATPTLCGAWVEPNQRLAAQITSGLVTVHYVSCTQCDLLASIRMRAMTA